MCRCNEKERSKKCSKKCSKKVDPLVGSWTVTRTGGTPRDLTSEGTVTFNADGTAVFNFASYLGVPTPNRPVLLACPPSSTWRKIGYKKYEFFAQSVVAFTTPDPDHAQLSLFPAGNVLRVTCQGKFILSTDGSGNKVVNSIPGSDVCNFYAANDLTLSTPIAPPNTGETYYGVKVGIY